MAWFVVYLYGYDSRIGIADSGKRIDMCGKCSDIMFLCVDSRCCVVNPAFFVSVAESPVRIVVAFGIAVAEICLGGKDNSYASFFKRGYKIVE